MLKTIELKACKFCDFKRILYDVYKFYIFFEKENDHDILNKKEHKKLYDTLWWLKNTFLIKTNGFKNDFLNKDNEINNEPLVYNYKHLDKKTHIKKIIKSNINDENNKEIIKKFIYVINTYNRVYNVLCKKKLLYNYYIPDTILELGFHEFINNNDIYTLKINIFNKPGVEPYYSKYNKQTLDQWATEHNKENEKRLTFYKDVLSIDILSYN